jgi:hypothetical protein
MFSLWRQNRKNIHEYTTRKNRMAVLVKYNDGSRLILSTVYELMKIPNWRGNRILDTDHARKLCGDVEDIRNLDKGYCVIVIPEEDGAGQEIKHRYIVDGQHRLSVLREARDTGFFPDFPVTYTEKDVDDQSAAIEYFNTINSMKPMPPQGQDPKLLVGDFIGVLERQFRPSKKIDIRIKQGRAHFPNISVEVLRPILAGNIDRLRIIKPVAFAERVWQWNRAKVEEFARERSLSEEDDKRKDRCIEINFALAFDPKLPWIVACLQ